MAGRLKLDEICRGRRLIVTLGPGGVGKTTLAAALGLQAAASGRRALVMTVDPALRLADALGMHRLEPGKRGVITRRQLARCGLTASQRLQVSMLDTGTSLAAAVERQLPAGERRARILGHPFFRRLQRDLAGAREYAAIEEVIHLLSQPDIDQVIVDTPPSNHALDFLEAPEKLLEVIDNQAWRWLMRPALLAGRAGLLALDFAGGYMVRTISRFTGLDFLRELAGFLELLSGMVEGFRQRAAEFRHMVRSEQCALVLVTSAEERPAEETLRLRRTLAARGLEPQLVLVNRVMPAPPAPPPGGRWRDQLLRAMQGASAEGTAAKEALLRLEGMHRLQTELARRATKNVEELRRTLGGAAALATVPLLAQDICDLEGLVRLRQAIFTAPARREMP